MRGAKIASRIKTAITEAPNSARRLEKKVLRKSWRRLRVSTPGATSVSCCIWASAIASLVPHPGVQDRVEDVHQEVHQHEERRPVEDHALHHRVVALVDGLVGDLAYPRPGEDGLRDHRPAHQKPDLKPYYRNSGQHGVPEGVLEDHPPGDDTLGAGREI